MTTSRLPRRAIVGAVLAASLIGTGLIASAADASCMTFTDPKGDSAPVDAPMVPAPEDDLDITGVAFDTVDTNLVVSLYVAKLNVAPEYSLGDSFKVFFKHGTKEVGLYAYRYNPTEIGDGLGEAYPQTGMTVAGDEKATTMKVAYDTKASKVVYTIPLADVDKATATPTAGASFSTLTAEASGDNILFAEAWDDAAAPKDLTYAVGTACGGGAPAAPAPVVAPSAQPSPAAPPAASGPAAAGAPTPDCFTAKDPKDDAYYPHSAVPHDPDLDILGVTLGTTKDALVGYFKVDKLAAGPATLNGHRFTLNFTFNKHTFAAAGSAYKNAEAAQVREGAASSGRFGHVTQLAVDGSGIPPSSAEGAQTIATGSSMVASGLKYTFDVKTSTVSMSLPLADIEKYGKAPLAGSTLSAVYVTAATDTSALASTWDTAPDGGSATASKLTYAVGDNHCFAPPVPPLSSVGAVKAQYGDVAAVAAKLVDAAGAPVAGKTVTFTVGASKATGTTGADGVAKAALLVKEKAGNRSLVITSDATTTTVPFTVLVEKTVLKAVGGKAGVTATLIDDDKTPVTGQVITFTSGSKKVTAKTDAKGIAKATGLPPGNIKVTYAGAAGMYTAASTTTKAS